ncbi:MAG: hypothetical protein PUD93_12685 [Lachnospiraceae bacterium]|nr:hypothetical protein [Lachnospiraceae bacterium]
MLRTAVKKQMISLLDSMCENHHGGVIKNPYFFEDSQQAAITIGETIECKVPENKDIVPLLEEYCEVLFQLSQREEIQESDIQQLDTLLFAAKDKVINLQSGYQVAFFPYKASMWDSLESIWKAFSKDQRCECIVVPIPYRDFDAKNNKWNSCYELSDFPEYVPVRDYQSYSIETEQPDVAFIHNPYDDYNRVTCVYPQFFSREIKKHVGKLVYVPYYITTGNISPEHLYVPVCQNMDYMIAQSEKFKSGCEGMNYYDKVLPLGSPKADRVINMCHDGVEIPEDWRTVLAGKKSVMLNTSIYCFLNYGDIYFDKLKHIFQWFKKRDDVVLIWRPHPLLESTVKSMRPQLMEKYQELLTYFNDEQIGIWDNTPDITRTIAIVDAYIGEEVSSVVILFGVAGKPIFILDNTFFKSCDEMERRRAYLGRVEKISGKYYCTSFYNGLYIVDEEFEKVELVMQFDGQPRFVSPYGNFKAVQNTIYLSPSIANMPISYRTDTGECKALKPSAIDGFYALSRVVSYGEKIYYLPAGDSGILVYNRRDKSWKEQQDCILHLKQNASVVGGTTCNCCENGRELWITAEYTNRVICYDMKNDTYQIFALGDEHYGFSGIVADKKNVWLAEVHTGDIVHLNRCEGKLNKYALPDDAISWCPENGRRMVLGELIDMGKYLVAAPVFTDTMIRFNKKEKSIDRLIPEFWEGASEKYNGYNPRIHSACCSFNKLDDSHIQVQRTWDGALAVVDVMTGEYTLHNPVFTEKTMHKLTDGQDGFEKFQTYYAFCRRESRLFSFEGFMEDLVNDRLEDVKKRQKTELASVAANLDGTCGEKVYEYMMKIFENNQ